MISKLFKLLKDDSMIQETCTEGKIMPADFYKETPRAFGHTTSHFQKSQNHVQRTKIVTTVPLYFLLVLFSLFATAHGRKNFSQKKKYHMHGLSRVCA